MRDFEGRLRVPYNPDELTEQVHSVCRMKIFEWGGKSGGCANKKNYITQAKQEAISDISELSVCFCCLMRFLFVL